MTARYTEVSAHHLYIGWCTLQWHYVCLFWFASEKSSSV